ncbi:MULTISPECIES: nitronate monooxygenase family protein [unclassified Rhodococcus (in: high G+C Gram-positive bacteria)]|uniref:NAD(P)H-dependent flavin oxidoreductase n=1 Tax=unclassified Rhodococcus (in: high G+C Gram-positive bacteria) TaxID=192944 RepID=UPI00163A6220|nr:MULTISPECIES: nitronate monooxygenase [unclassified Rhodococcus (in: high G+C Gram-positive bacteria)]MBC2638287.1 nitronate monooxygenase [Rhodococcus sp. 3A]MBC2896972.1 nitronate monooxygenase [Rhodococcus sp. 4CII]
MSLQNRLTEKFGIEHPVVLAPMDYVSDRRLATAVAEAGGLGLIGGGYGDETWLQDQFDHVMADAVGCGFITWSMAQQPQLLQKTIGYRPAAVFLSFGDPAPHAPAIRAAGIPLICQVHNLAQARRAIEVGASVIAAQGGEAGGHGTGTRSTFTLVPEIADYLQRESPEVMLLAAGGIGDGRGLAAALALGADGALVGTRFWAAEEAAIPRAAQHRALRAGGDDTIRQSAFDIVREKPWPTRYSGRVLHNGFIRRWHGDEPGLRNALREMQEQFLTAVKAENYDVANLIIGEVIGQIDRVETVASIMDDMVGTAAAILGRSSHDLVSIGS